MDDSETAVNARLNYTAGQREGQANDAALWHSRAVSLAERLAAEQVAHDHTKQELADMRAASSKREVDISTAEKQLAALRKRKK